MSAASSIDPDSLLMLLIESAPDEATRDIAMHVQSHFEQRLWYEFSEALVELMTRSSAIRALALSIHDALVVRVRLELSPDIYTKLIYFAASQASTTAGGSTTAVAAADTPVDDDARGSGGAFHSLLMLLDGAAATLSSSQAPQHVRAVHCIRALVLMQFGPDVEARRIILDVRDFLQTIPSQDLSALLQALYHRALVCQCEQQRDHDQFYRVVFPFVTYAQAAGIPVFADELFVLSYKTAIAALLSKDVYNFGQLVNFAPFRPFFELQADGEGSKQTSKNAFAASNPLCAVVMRIVTYCNGGEIAALEAYVKEHREAIAAAPDFHSAFASGRLGRKVRLMALLHFVYFTPPNQRTFTFASIADRCALPVTDVEVLVLSAFAQKLIQGKIDGLNGTVECTWAQPRILSLAEIRQLAGNIGAWRKEVEAVSRHMAEISKDIPK